MPSFLSPCIAMLAISAMASAAAPAAALELRLCYNYDCASEGRAAFSEAELAEIGELFEGVGEPAAEREAVSRAVAAFYRLAAQQLPIGNDKGRNETDGDVDGRMDCIDHSADTTLFLFAMEQRGWLRFHSVLDPVARGEWVILEHWSARIAESGTGDQFAVDSWFFAPGEPAAVMPLAEWRGGRDPE